MNMGNYGYLSPQPHAVTRVDNIGYLKASASRRTTYNAFAKAARLGSTTYGFSPYYYNKDHLGNIREVVSMGGTVQQVTNYYPFGAPYADPNAVMGANVQPYKYIFSIEREKRKLACSSEREKKRQKVNGKELDRMHGLDTYDYGARQYDPILARWDRVDPLCEKYYSISPYAYCANNPVKYLDIDGREIWIHYYDKDGQEQSFQYTAGMQSNVDNSTAQTIVANLNMMYKNQSGAKVLDAILTNNTKYGFMQTDTHSDNGEGYLNPATNIVSLHDVNNTLSLAEETFHIYQSVNNQGGTTAVNEVEAKLFSAKMNFEISKWNNGDYLNNLLGKEGVSYSDDMFSLFMNGYDERHFRGAVNSFFSGSLSGQHYKDVLKYEQGTISSKPLIMDFLPVKGF